MYKRLTIVIILALGLRLWGINWDMGFHLHPDERFLTMVGVAMKFGKYFDTQNSLLNPHNIGFSFYVYGTWPVILTKAMAIWTQKDNYEQLILVGRFMSAVFDTGTVVFIYLIARKIFKKEKSAVIAALFYAFCPLPIQLSHYFTVDTFLVFGLTASFYFLLKKNYLILGIVYGLAIAAKVSAAIVAPVIFLAWIFEKYNFREKILKGFEFVIVCLISVRVFYPYLFDGVLLNNKVLQNWQTLKTFDTPGYFPPATQWINSTPYIFPLLNTIFFGLGLPISIIIFIAFIKFRKIIKEHPDSIWLYLWILIIVAFQGIQFAKPLRYIYPIYPAAIVLAGYFASKIKRKGWLLAICLLVVGSGLMFERIYSRPHSRVRATDWILRHIPAGSTISCEYWDDCLPLVDDNRYKVVTIYPYDPDSPEKIAQLKKQIANIDYLVFSSNRLYASIPATPNYYPYTSKWYEDLFAGKLGFIEVAEITSRPNIPIPGIYWCITPPYFNYGFVSKGSQLCPQRGISLVDDYAEESWTVYDHPKVIIFKNTQR